MDNALFFIIHYPFWIMDANIPLLMDNARIAALFERAIILE